jgi:hypothetical protein
MDIAHWIVALPFWLLGAPLLLAFFDLARTRSGRDGSSVTTR